MPQFQRGYSTLCIFSINGSQVKQYVQEMWGTASAKYLNVRPSDLRENKPVSLIIFLRPADQHCRKSSRNHLFKSTYMVQITLIRRSWVASGVLRLSEMHDPHPPACPPPSAHSCKNCGTAQKRKSLSDGQTQTRKAFKGKLAGHSRKDFHSTYSRLRWRQFSSSTLGARGGS